jgi:hypothetical protein
VHQRAAELMEVVFRDRIEEFYETIAFHYQKSGNRDKAVEYLIKAAGKSMVSYASAGGKRLLSTGLRDPDRQGRPKRRGECPSDTTLERLGFRLLQPRSLRRLDRYIQEAY